MNDATWTCTQTKASLDAAPGVSVTFDRTTPAPGGDWWRTTVTRAFSFADAARFRVGDRYTDAEVLD